jgi:glycosyltransferase involved in cell wall biosynthesis
MVKEFPPYINYCGVIDAFKSVDTIKNYYLQVFPTKYQTEGIPGSIVDSFFSGVPVIASMWNSAKDVIDDNSTGFLYRFNDNDDLKQKLIFAYNNPQKIQEMKIKCLEKSYQYQPSEAIKVVLNELND